MGREPVYFEEEDGERCYGIDEFQDRIRLGEKKIFLREAKRDFGSGFMWCQVDCECIESGDGACGIVCEDYKPRNGLSGRCVYLDNTFTPIGEVLVLTEDGLVKK